MKTRIALLVLPFTLLAACGSESAATFTLASGTYAVSSATSAIPSDECGLLAAYQDSSKRIGITVNGTTASFNLANDPAADPASMPTATIDGNSIRQLVEANYTVAFGGTCVVRVHRHVTGDITANDQAALTLAFDAATDAGTCDASSTSFAKLPCTSSYHFLTKKQ
jgi:hypothetical protein